MPFGLRNAPATFSRIVVKLLRGLDDFSGAYLDDIINFSPSWTAHAEHLRTVLTRVRDAHLTLSPTKCQFAAVDLDYLGHRYSTIEKEALSLVLAVRYFSVYFGTGVVTVYTDPVSYTHLTLPTIYSV